MLEELKLLAYGAGALVSLLFAPGAIGQQLPSMGRAVVPPIPKVVIPPIAPVTIPSAAVRREIEDPSLVELDRVRRISDGDRKRIERDSDRGAAAGHLLDLVPWISGVFGVIGAAGSGAAAGSVAPMLHEGAGIAGDQAIDAFHGRLLNGSAGGPSAMQILGNPKLTGSSVDAKVCAVFRDTCRR